MSKIHLQKAFFGKDNCLKLTLNADLECYMEFGTPKPNSKEWNWKPVKFNDVEIGEIINVLEGKKQSVSFFHDFKGDKTQIWINKSEKFFSIKVKELSKGLNDGEQRVLLELLKHIIIRMNIKL
ncbi:hypothetical protein JXA48_00510 [Candidatus Woesearchaeota archaeon]|nr:hypothetical protein [Candidatus Woesearchaeota archaeon]